MKLLRNAACWCGSGKKYKNCHLTADLAAAAERNAPPVPHARDIFEIRENILAPKQVRSDEIGPSRR
jgi:methionyl aminopeptidase